MVPRFRLTSCCLLLGSINSTKWRANHISGLFCRLDSVRVLTQLRSMAQSEEYQRKIAAAVMKAIFDVSLTEIDGKPTAYIATAEVMEALVNVMASMMEGAPGCQSSAGIREMSTAVASKLNVRTREMRQIIEETGQRPFDSITIKSN